MKLLRMLAEKVATVIPALAATRNISAGSLFLTYFEI